MMNTQYFLGEQSTKFKEWCEQHYGQTETENGKWIIYDAQENPIGELSTYVFDRGIRTWSSSSIQNAYVLFGSSRISIIPIWSFQYPGKNIEITSDNIHDSKAKILTATCVSSTPQENYVLKWFKV